MTTHKTATIIISVKLSDMSFFLIRYNNKIFLIVFL